MPSLTAVQPLHVATWIEGLTAKQRLAAVRALFDWLVVGQVVAVNSAASIRGPRHVVRVGKTPVLDPAEARALLDSIDGRTVIGLRDHALIGLMVYSFARVGAALAMRGEDVYPQSRRLWVRLREKGGKGPCAALPPHARRLLAAYLDGRQFAGRPQGGAVPDDRSLPQASAHAMVRRRAAAAGIATPLGCHSFRATGITAYLANGGTLETAAAMANHASTRTTQLYDRRGDRVSLDEVERIRI